MLQAVATPEARAQTKAQLTYAATAAAEAARSLANAANTNVVRPVATLASSAGLTVATTATATVVSVGTGVRCAAKAHTLLQTRECDSESALLRLCGHTRAQGRADVCRCVQMCADVCRCVQMCATLTGNYRDMHC
eukprot:5988684-Pyramimonas_sp.AAC.1